MFSRINFGSWMDCALVDFATREKPSNVRSLQVHISDSFGERVGASSKDGSMLFWMMGLFIIATKDTQPQPKVFNRQMEKSKWTINVRWLLSDHRKRELNYIVSWLFQIEYFSYCGSLSLSWPPPISSLLVCPCHSPIER